MTRTYDPKGFREIGTGHTHARTELRHGDRYYSIPGTGTEVRAMLTEKAESVR